LPTDPELIVDFLVPDAEGAGALIAGTAFKGFFKSTNGGAGWQAMNQGLPIQGFHSGLLYAVRALSIDRSNPERMFAATGTITTTS
jgi:hypothetical protein